VAPLPPFPPQTNVHGVTAATNFSSDLGHEDREVCKSQRGEGSLSAFHRGGDRNYADRVFDFVDLVLIALAARKSHKRKEVSEGCPRAFVAVKPQTAKPSALPTPDGFAFVPNPRAVFLDGIVGLSNRR
jgi:hypothetical protein